MIILLATIQDVSIVLARSQEQAKLASNARARITSLLNIVTLQAQLKALQFDLQVMRGKNYE